MKNFAKKLLRKTPALKRFAKRVFKGSLEKAKQKQTAAYHEWLGRVEPSIEELQAQSSEAKKLIYQPLLSVVTPTFNTPKNFLREMIESVQAQTYENWELILVDDASSDDSVREIIKQYAAQDARITYSFLKEGLHIAGATNEAMRLARGEFISLFDHDDVLRPNALYEIALTLNENSELDFIYTDEDKLLDDTGVRTDPFFKPDWNQDFLYSVNYITHFTTIRRAVLNKVGYEDGQFNGAQDWELFLRVLRFIPEEHIHHIPKVLYSWRVHSASTAQSLEAKPYVLEAQQRAISDDLTERGVTSFALSRDELHPAQWKLEFPVKKKTTFSVLNPNSRLFLSKLKKAKGEVLIFSTEPHKKSADKILASDALRGDIGFVVPMAKTNGQVLQNIRSVLTAEVSQYLEGLSDSLSHHYYRTARYNVGAIEGYSVIAVENAKIQAIVQKNPDVQTTQQFAQLLADSGYRHLYNPYAKV